MEGAEEIGNGTLQGRLRMGGLSHVAAAGLSAKAERRSRCGFTCMQSTPLSCTTTSPQSSISPSEYDCTVSKSVIHGVTDLT